MAVTATRRRALRSGTVGGPQTTDLRIAKAEREERLFLTREVREALPTAPSRAVFAIVGAIDEHAKARRERRELGALLPDIKLAVEHTRQAARTLSRLLEHNSVDAWAMTTRVLSLPPYTGFIRDHRLGRWRVGFPMHSATGIPFRNALQHVVSASENVANLLEAGAFGPRKPRYEMAFDISQIFRRFKIEVTLGPDGAFSRVVGIALFTVEGAAAPRDVSRLVRTLVGASRKAGWLPEARVGRPKKGDQPQVSRLERAAQEMVLLYKKRPPVRST